MSSPLRLELHPGLDDDQLLGRVVAYYSATLKKSAEALDFLRKRGLEYPAMIDHFRLGFSDRSLGLQLPDRQLKSGAAIRTRLQAVGLYRASGHEHFRGSLTIPIPAADGSGRIADIHGRKVGGVHLRKGTPLDTFLGDQRRGVWNIASFGATEEIVLCTSLLDAMTFWCHGYRNATTAFGSVTADLLAAFREFDIRRVLAADEKLTEPLLAAGLEVFLVRLPPGLDANGYARQTKDPADALGGLLRAAEWVGKGQPPSRPAPAPQPVVDPAVPSLADLLDADGEVEVGNDPDEDEPAAIPAGEVAAANPAQPVEPSIRTASPVPPVPPADEVAVTETEVVLTFGSRKYRVRGFDRNGEPGVLRINLMARNGVGLHADTFDLYAHKARKGFQEQVAAELRVEEATVKRDLGRVLLKLEELQDAARSQAATPAARPDMAAGDERAALDLLRDPNLLDRVAADFRIAGDRATKLAAYLGAVSRKMPAPVSVLIQSMSAAGKTALMDAALGFVPPEEVVRFSALTGQSLYYLADGDLSHKVLAVAEEAGAARASYALKLLASEGELRIASTGKDAGTGRLVTQEYRVSGPTAVFLTTTSAEVDDELANRCLVLAVAEGRDQTRAVHAHQRRAETLAGLVAAEEHAAVMRVHQNAQRLLKSVRVINPWAEKLTFSDAKTRTRRDHAKYLSLIRVISFLHQHQRPARTAEVNGKAVEYIEVTLEDIAAANEIATAVLGRGLDDLPAQTRNLLVLADRMAEAGCEAERLDRRDYRFTARQLRESCGWGQTQLKVHLRRLLDHEFVLAHRDRHARRTVYELAVGYDGDGRVLPGLIDVDALRRGEWSDGGESGPGANAHRSGHGRGTVGPRPGYGRGEDNKQHPPPQTASSDATSDPLEASILEPALEVEHAEEG